MLVHYARVNGFRRADRCSCFRFCVRHLIIFNFTFFLQILKANINTYLPQKTDLKTAIIASKLRFLPYSHHRRTVCMRVEIYGCTFRGQWELSVILILVKLFCKIIRQTPEELCMKRHRIT